MNNFGSLRSELCIVHYALIFHLYPGKYFLDKCVIVCYNPSCSCGCSSSGRAPPCQGGGSEFEPRHPLQKDGLFQPSFFVAF